MDALYPSLIDVGHHQTVDMHIVSSIGPARKRMVTIIPTLLLNLVLLYTDYRLIIQTGLQ